MCGEPLLCREERINKSLEEVITLAKTFTDPILMNKQFDVVAIDEASIAPLPMLFYVCSLAKEKAVIFGDPKQLAPIKLATTIAAEKWLKKDIFLEADAIEKNPKDPRIQSLNNQYRMHLPFIDCARGNFYSSDNLTERVNRSVGLISQF
jgi:superfamily I DNA and/or RNA helicase